MLISREDESSFPSFMNHKSARQWFKERYGNRFIMTSTETIDDTKYYFYHLVENKKVYLESTAALKNGQVVTGLDFMNSYQSIEITEHGHVHVIY